MKARPLLRQGLHWDSVTQSAVPARLLASINAKRSAERRRRQIIIDQLNIAELKSAMAAAHPDRGGTNADFIAARARYVAARRSLRSAS
jgi:hypothetical protein